MMALEVLNSLVISPPNHCNVHVYNHSTILHEEVNDYCEPILDIISTWKNSPHAQASLQSLMTSPSVSKSPPLIIMHSAEPFTSLFDLFDSKGLPTEKSRVSQWWRQFFSVNNGLDSFKVVLRCFVITIIVHPAIDQLDSFFAAIPRLQRDMIFVLQYQTEHGLSDIHRDYEELCTLCLEGLKYIGNRSESVYSDNEYVKARLMPPFDSILQMQLGIDYSQDNGLLPNLLSNEIQWLCGLMTLAYSDSVEAALLQGNATEVIRSQIARLKRLEHLVLLSISLLLIPKATISFLNYGILTGIISVIEKNHTGFNTRKRMLMSAESISELKSEYDRLLFGRCVLIRELESSLVQMLDMMVSSKASALKLFSEIGGAKITLDQLKFEADNFSAVAAADDATTPGCHQSFILSLTALSRACLSAETEAEVVEEVMTLFKDCVLSLCRGYAMVSVPILTELIDILVERIEDDPSTTDLLNKFLTNGVIRSVCTAANNLTVPFDDDFIENFLYLLESVCLKKESRQLIETWNPFKLIFDMFVFDSRTPLREQDLRKQQMKLWNKNNLMQPSIGAGMGGQIKDLLDLRESETLIDACASAVAFALTSVSNMFEDVFEGSSKLPGEPRSSGQECTALSFASTLLLCIHEILLNRAFAASFVEKHGGIKATMKLALHCANLNQCMVSNLLVHRKVERLLPTQIRFPLVNILRRLSRNYPVLSDIESYLEARFQILRFLSDEAVSSSTTSAAVEPTPIRWNGVTPVRKRANEAKKKRPRGLQTPNSSAVKKKRKGRFPPEETTSTLLVSIVPNSAEKWPGFTFPCLFGQYFGNSVLSGIVCATEYATNDSKALKDFKVCTIMVELHIILDLVAAVVKDNSASVNNFSVSSVASGLISLQRIICDEIARGVVGYGDPTDWVEDSLERLAYILPGEASILVMKEIPTDDVNSDSNVVATIKPPAFAKVKKLCRSGFQDEGRPFFALSSGEGYILGGKSKFIELVSCHRIVGDDISSESWHSAAWDIFVGNLLSLTRNSIDETLSRFDMAQKASPSEKYKICWIHLASYLPQFRNLQVCNEKSTSYLLSTLHSLAAHLKSSSTIVSRLFADANCVLFFEGIFQSYTNLLCMHSANAAQLPAETSPDEQDMVALLLGSETFIRLFRLLRGKEQRPSTLVAATLHCALEQFSPLWISHDDHFVLPFSISISLADMFVELFLCSFRCLQATSDPQDALYLKISGRINMMANNFVSFFVNICVYNSGHLFSECLIDKLVYSIPSSKRSQEVFAISPLDCLKTLLRKLCDAKLLFVHQRYSYRRVVQKSAETDRLRTWHYYFIVMVALLEVKSSVNEGEGSMYYLNWLRLINQMLEKKVNLYSSGQYRDALILVLQRSTHFQKLYYSLVDNLMPQFNSMNSNSSDVQFACLEETVRLIAVFVEPIFVSTKLVDYVNSFRNLVISDFVNFDLVQSPIPPITSKMSESEAVHVLRNFQSIGGKAQLSNFQQLADACFRIISTKVPRNFKPTNKRVQSLEETATMILLHLSRDPSAARLIFNRQHASLLLSSDLFDYSLKRLAVSSIFVYAIESLHPSILSDKMEQTLALAIGEAVANNRNLENTSYHLEAAASKVSLFLSQLLSAMLLREPDTFYSVVHNTDFPALIDSFCPLYYSSSFTRNIYRSPFEEAKKSEIVEVSLLAEWISAEIFDVYSQWKQSTDSLLLLRMADILIITVDVMHSLTLCHSLAFFSNIRIGELSLVQWILKDLYAAFDFDTIFSFQSRAPEKDIIVTRTIQAYSASLYCLLATASFEGLPRKLLFDEMCGRLHETVDALDRTIGVAGDDFDLKYVIYICDFMNALQLSPHLELGISRPFVVSEKDLSALIALSDFRDLFVRLQGIILKLNDVNNVFCNKWMSKIVKTFSRAYIFLFNDAVASGEAFVTFAQKLCFTNRDWNEVNSSQLLFFNVNDLCKDVASHNAEESSSDELHCFENIVDDIVAELVGDARNEVQHEGTLSRGHFDSGSQFEKAIAGLTDINLEDSASEIVSSKDRKQVDAVPAIPLAPIECGDSDLSTDGWERNSSSDGSEPSDTYGRNARRSRMQFNARPARHRLSGRGHHEVHDNNDEEEDNGDAGDDRSDEEEEFDDDYYRGSERHESEDGAGREGEGSGMDESDGEHEEEDEDDDEDEEDDDFTNNNSDTDDDDTEDQSKEEDASASSEQFSLSPQFKSVMDLPGVYESVRHCPGNIKWDISSRNYNSQIRSHRLRSCHWPAFLPRKWGTDLHSAIEDVSLSPIADFLSLSIMKWCLREGSNEIATTVVSNAVERQLQRYRRPTKLNDILSFSPSCIPANHIDSETIRFMKRNMIFHSNRPQTSIVAVDIFGAFSLNLANLKSRWQAAEFKRYADKLKEDFTLSHLQDSLNFLYKQKSKLITLRRVLWLFVASQFCICDEMEQYSIEYDIFLLDIVLYQIYKLRNSFSGFKGSRESFLILQTAGHLAFKHIFEYFDCRLESVGSTLSADKVSLLLLLLSKLVRQILAPFVVDDQKMKDWIQCVPPIDSIRIGGLVGVLLRDDLCDWMDDSSPVGRIKASETTLPSAFRYLVSILGYLVGRRSNWALILSVLSPIASRVLLDAEMEMNTDVENLSHSQVEGSFRSGGERSIAYRRLLYFISIVDSTAKKMASLHHGKDRSPPLVIPSSGSTVGENALSEEGLIRNIAKTLQTPVKKTDSSQESLRLNAPTESYGEGQIEADVILPSSEGNAEDLVRADELALFVFLENIRQSSLWTSLARIVRLFNKKKQPFKENPLNQQRISKANSSTASSMEMFGAQKMFIHGLQRFFPLFTSLFLASSMHLAMSEGSSAVAGRTCPTDKAVEEKSLHRPLKFVFESPRKAHKPLEVLKSPQVEADRAPGSSEGRESIVDALFVVVEENKKYINAKLLQSPRLLESEYRVSISFHLNLKFTVAAHLRRSCCSRSWSSIWSLV